MTRRRKILTTLVLAAVLATGVGGVWAWRTHTDEYRVARLLEEAHDEGPRGISGWLIDLGISDRRATRHLDLIGEDLLVIGSPAVPQLIEALTDRNESVAVFAAHLLGRIGDRRATEPLVEALDSPRWLLQLEATRALGDLGDARAARALVTVLESTYDFLPDVAADALAQIGPPAIEPLIDALKYDDTFVRRMAAKALGDIGDERAVTSLVAALTDDDLSVRGAAAEALDHVGDLRAVEPLIEALSDDEWHVRAQAAQALGRLGDDRATGPLTGLLYDENGIVRVAVANALHELGVSLDD